MRSPALLGQHMEPVQPTDSPGAGVRCRYTCGGTGPRPPRGTSQGQEAHGYHDEHTSRANASTEAWTPLHADDVRRHTFHETALGRRRYRQGEVDLYVGQLATEIQRWTTAYDAATAEVTRLRNFFRHHGGDPVAWHDHSDSTQGSTVLTAYPATGDRR